MSTPEETKTIPAGVWITVQGVPVQLRQPIEVSAEDYARIEARMPTRKARTDDHL